jgi:two-component system chemotaxis response regulator CheB
MPQRNIVVIGASAGGVTALQRLVGRLPADLPASLFIVLHLSPESGALLPEILTRAGPLPAVNARHDDEIRTGCIYVAPPDRHLLLLQPGRVSVGYGPKENRFRPAVDPLFRSAALTYGPRVIAIVLTGGLDDGTAGLCAVKQAGGMAIVQNPEEAEISSMPLNALRHVAADHVLTLDRIASLLPRLVREPAPPPPAGSIDMADEIRIEVAVAADERLPADITKLGRPSVFTCPECHGSLLRMMDGPQVRYRCHTGHAFTALSLEEELRENVEDVTWGAVRALQEHAMLLSGMAEEPGVTREESGTYREQADDARRRAALVRDSLAKGPGNGDG